MATKQKHDEIKVGEQVEIDGPSGLVVLPNGSVVTCRSVYTVQHTGEHRIGDRVFIGIEKD